VFLVPKKWPDSFICNTSFVIPEEWAAKMPLNKAKVNLWKSPKVS
jgi:hypothetical protein